MPAHTRARPPIHTKLAGHTMTVVRHTMLLPFRGHIERVQFIMFFPITSRASGELHHVCPRSRICERGRMCSDRAGFENNRENPFTVILAKRAATFDRPGCCQVVNIQAHRHHEIFHSRLQPVYRWGNRDGGGTSCLRNRTNSTAYDCSSFPP